MTSHTAQRPAGPVLHQEGINHPVTNEADGQAGEPVHRRGGVCVEDILGQSCDDLELALGHYGMDLLAVG